MDYPHIAYFCLFICVISLIYQFLLPRIQKKINTNLLSIIFFSLSISFIGQSCKTTTLPMTAQVEFLDNPANGLVVVEAVGYGKSDDAARSNAFKTAFETIFFKGLPRFSALSKPMISNESKAKSAHPVFFENFVNQGTYLQFVTYQAQTTYLGKTGSGKMKSARQEFTINYVSLRRHLEQNHIIRKFGL